MGLCFRMLDRSDLRRQSARTYSFQRVSFLSFTETVSWSPENACFRLMTGARRATPNGA